LQHALGVTYHDGKLYVADTYNNKVKVVDAKTGATKTLAGTGEHGLADSPAQFDEPAGISYANGTLYIADTNNHLVRTIHLGSGSVGRFEIQGLVAPTR
jgi:YVTN family beta-propeller protein